jgi:hypothetical protein
LDFLKLNSIAAETAKSAVNAIIINGNSWMVGVGEGDVICETGGVDVGVDEVGKLVGVEFNDGVDVSVGIGVAGGVAVGGVVWVCGVKRLKEN